MKSLVPYCPQQDEELSVTDLAEYTASLKSLVQGEEDCGCRDFLDSPMHSIQSNCWLNLSWATPMFLSTGSQNFPPALIRFLGLLASLVLSQNPWRNPINPSIGLCETRSSQMEMILYSLPRHNGSIQVLSGCHN